MGKVIAGEVIPSNPSTGIEFSGNAVFTGIVSSSANIEILNVSSSANLENLDVSNLGVSGKVKMGAGSPAEKLDIDGNIKILDGSITLATATNNWKITISGNDLIFSADGVDKMKLDANGNLTVVGNISAYGTV